MIIIYKSWPVLPGDFTKKIAIKCLKKGSNRNIDGIYFINGCARYTETYTPDSATETLGDAAIKVTESLKTSKGFKKSIKEIYWDLDQIYLKTKGPTPRAKMSYDTQVNEIYSIPVIIGFNSTYKVPILAQKDGKIEKLDAKISSWNDPKRTFKTLFTTFLPDVAKHPLAYTLAIVHKPHDGPKLDPEDINQTEIFKIKLTKLLFSRRVCILPSGWTYLVTHIKNFLGNFGIGNRKKLEDDYSEYQKTKPEKKPKSKSAEGETPNVDQASADQQTPLTSSSSMTRSFRGSSLLIPKASQIKITEEAYKIKFEGKPGKQKINTDPEITPEKLTGYYLKEYIEWLKTSNTATGYVGVDLGNLSDTDRNNRVMMTINSVKKSISTWNPEEIKDIIGKSTEVLFTNEFDELELKNNANTTKYLVYQLITIGELRNLNKDINKYYFRSKTDNIECVETLKATDKLYDTFTKFNKNNPPSGYRKYQIATEEKKGILASIGNISVQETLLNAPLLDSDDDEDEDDKVCLYDYIADNEILPFKKRSGKEEIKASILPVGWVIKQEIWGTAGYEATNTAKKPLTSSFWGNFVRDVEANAYFNVTIGEKSIEIKYLKDKKKFKDYQDELKMYPCKVLVREGTEKYEPDALIYEERGKAIITLIKFEFSKEGTDPKTIYGLPNAPMSKIATKIGANANEMIYITNKERNEFYECQSDQTLEKVLSNAIQASTLGTDKELRLTTTAASDKIKQIPASSGINPETPSRPPLPPPPKTVTSTNPTGSGQPPPSTPPPSMHVLASYTPENLAHILTRMRQGDVKAQSRTEAEKGGYVQWMKEALTKPEVAAKILECEFKLMIYDKDNTRKIEPLKLNREDLSLTIAAIVKKYKPADLDLAKYDCTCKFKTNEEVPVTSANPKEEHNRYVLEIASTMNKRIINLDSKEKNVEPDSDNDDNEDDQ
ncbi:MAG: hypothetical protein NkDv07_0926 [Candidatus Improbicoccus devescovinae]|nr:MAG: hypothetical protein NkDv07_0926 [Candidatus Improbicoccus devescovinae]